MSSQRILKISARKTKKIEDRICQGDIFKDIEIIENFRVEGSKVAVDKISFPYVVCLNQECDLERDFENQMNHKKDNSLLHLAIAPVFNFDQFLNGTHWGDIFINNKTSKRKDTKIKLIMDNEMPRFHYLNFPDSDSMPELIIDFKHFFTINRNMLYSKIDSRVCSLDDLFKERLSQRFSNFISRIGLPVEVI